jgi:hypothetical protein
MVLASLWLLAQHAVVEHTLLLVQQFVTIAWLGSTLTI